MITRLLKELIFALKNNFFSKDTSFGYIKIYLLLSFIGCSAAIRPSIYYLDGANSIFIDPRNHFIFAKSLLGKHRAVFKNKEYRADCSGTVKAIYNSIGLSLGKAEGTQNIFKYIKKNGKLDRRNARSGDLVFFYSSNKSRLAHVGFVEEILPDKTIIFIHHIGGLIIRSHMNVQYPNIQIDPKNKTKLNDVLRGGFSQGHTAGQLFAAFGRFPKIFI